jgi:hypothetical protein
LEHHQYSAATAKHLQFRDAALASQELAAAEDKGKSTAIMFALLQEQHKAQLESMVASNKLAMDAMFEHKNVLVAGQGKAVDKENTLPANNRTGSGTGGTKYNRKRCMHCGKHVFHKVANCYELKANASKHWTGWKLVKDDSARA